MIDQCPTCQDTRRLFSLKLIPTNRTDDFYPKYIPQVKELCFQCGRYIKFAKQTPELIDVINKQLEGIKIEL